MIPFLRISKSQALRGLAFFVLFLAASCQDSRVEPPVVPAQEVARVLERDEVLVRQLRKQNLQLRHDILEFKSSGQWQKTGYFSAEESDRVEGLLFEYHAIHGQLLRVAERYAKAKKGTRARDVRAFAQHQLIAQAEFAVKTFEGDEVAIKKLNQRFPRSEIPARTYDHLVDILKPQIERRAKSLGRQIEDEFSQSMYAAQAELFFRVSRFKNPSAHLIRFSEEQKREVVGMLEPGDLVLSYTSGYVSSFFIPGEFKHAMIFVGTVEDRKRIGLVGSRVKLPGGRTKERQRWKDFKQSKTLEGRSANMIEAVAEGVKFSNLEHVMDTHINRLVVIRPVLSDRDRVLYLSRVFSYLGQEYDFEFDFEDASRQVCTELVYRSLNGISGIDYELEERSGRLALTADDTLNYWLDKNPERFKFVLFAEEEPMKLGHRAHILTGQKGEGRLRRLMRQ